MTLFSSSTTAQQVKKHPKKRFIISSMGPLTGHLPQRHHHSFIFHSQTRLTRVKMTNSRFQNQNHCSAAQPATVGGGWSIGTITRCVADDGPQEGQPSKAKQSSVSSCAIETAVDCSPQVVPVRRGPPVWEGARCARGGGGCRRKNDITLLQCIVAMAMFGPPRFRLCLGWPLPADLSSRMQLLNLLLWP